MNLVSSTQIWPVILTTAVVTIEATWVRDKWH